MTLAPAKTNKNELERGFTAAVYTKTYGNSVGSKSVKVRHNNANMSVTVIFDLKMALCLCLDRAFYSFGYGETLQAASETQS